MRASSSRADTNRTAPIARRSSSALRSGGIAMALTVVASARTKTISSSENAPGSSGLARSVAARPLTTASVLLLARGVGLRRDGDLGPKLQEALLAHSLHVHQLFDLLERAVLLAVLDDARGGSGADSGELLELGRGRGVQVDHRRRLGRLRVWLGGALRERLRRDQEREREH